MTGNQTSGFITKYEGLDFATVHGAGHDPQRSKRPEMLTLVYNFMFGTSWTASMENFANEFDY